MRELYGVSAANWAFYTPESQRPTAARWHACMMKDYEPGQEPSRESRCICAIGPT